MYFIHYLRTSFKVHLLLSHLSGGVPGLRWSTLWCLDCSERWSGLMKFLLSHWISIEIPDNRPEIPTIINIYIFFFFPTCQVRVVRFHVSCPASSFFSFSFSFSSAGPQLQALDRSFPRRTRTASSGSECSPPDLNRELRIRVFPAGPQPQRISEDIPDRMSENMLDKMWLPDRMSENMSNKCHLLGITRRK